MNFKHLFTELKRRNVFKVATAYAITGWLVIQVVATIAPQLNFPDWIPSFATIVVLCGFPVALVIAWVFELTSEGLKKTEAIEGDLSVAKQTGKKLNQVIIIVLSVALLFVLVERIFFANKKEKGDETIELVSIAVLPFVNMSEDQNNEYFSDGLSEELLNGLAKIEGMQVAGRTSSFSFKGKNEDIREIAEQLGVHHVLEGSVRKDGDQIRVTAQLVRADNGFHLWSETYDRKLNSVFAIQEEISRKVVDELKIRLLPDEEERLIKLPTNNIDAYNSFLEATQTETTRKPSDLEKAIALYKKAIDLDPDFTQAYARLAVAYGLLNDYGDIPYEDVLRLMRENVDKALLLDGNSGEGYKALAFLYDQTPDESARAIEAYQKAISLIPNDAFAHNALHSVLREVGEDEAADETLLRAYQLDPLSSPIVNNIAAMFQRKGDYAKALELVEENVARDPSFTAIYQVKLGILRNAPNGKLAEAFKVAHELFQKDTTDLQFLDFVGDIARDLDMGFLAQHYVDRMLLLYPNNFNVLLNVIATNMSTNSHQENIDYMLAARARFASIDPEASKRGFATPLVVSYGALGDFKEAIAVIEDAFPEIKAGTYTIDSVAGPSDNRQLARHYPVLLDQIEASNVSIPYKNKLAEHYNVKGMLEGGTARLEVIDLYNLLWVEALEGDVDVAVALMEEIYFKRKDKSTWEYYLKGDILPLIFEKEPLYQQMRDSIYTDLHQMRAEVVRYLKEKGEWQSKWDKELE